MGEQIGFRSRLTPDPLLTVDAGVCGRPASQRAKAASANIAVERVANLGTLISLGGWPADFRGLAAGMLRMGTRAVDVQTGAPPL